jgi:hypothetical protein
MAIVVTHTKVSTIPDGDDASLIRPSDWNETHTLVGLGTAAELNAGVANGVATLDAGGKVPVSELPAAVLGALSYQGTWDASTNTPTLTSSVGTKGYYYVVNVAGNTNLNGITDWQIGDWAVYNGTVWQKVDNTDAGGDVVGPASATDNAIARYDTTTGKLIQNSLVIIDDTGSVTGVNALTAESLTVNNNATLGSSNTDTLDVNARITTDLDPNVNNAKDIGTSGRNWRDGFFGRTLSTVNLELTGTTSFDGSQGTSGQVLTSAGTGNTPTWTTPTTGTVTSVSGTGTVSGISLSGTVTSSGNLTLGGTLDLSSPPTIGNTAPNTGKFTTLEATGTSSLGTASAQYIQAIGDALYPQVKAVGSGANIPLVLQPKGTGALQAQLTDSTAAGGNARGANAVDWQTSRSSASQVASGQLAIIAGGTNNTASGVYGAVVGGVTNTASGLGSFIGNGNNNIASGIWSGIVAGKSHTTAGYYNFVGGGQANSGTAASAVTTQSGTMNGTTAVTLSSSNANIKVGQYITGTSIAADTYVAAISGTSLTLSQAASGSSTSTLSFFTPHGVVVGGGNNQATGSYSFIGGGGDAGTAANRNVASGDWSFVGGGSKNVASGLGSVICGGGDGTATYSNTAIARGTFIGSGLNNNIDTNSQYSVITGGALNGVNSAQYSFIGGGYSNNANGQFSTIAGGGFGTARGILGNTVSPACFSPITGSSGVSQSGLLILGRQTTDATATALASNSSAAGTTNQVILPNNSAYYFTGTCIAGVTSGGNSKAWTFEGAIKRGANAASTTIVGSVVLNTIAQDAGASTWVIAITADTTNGGIRVTVTGQAATTIRWVSKIETTEMTY